jgi:hypothetical protein
MKNKNKPFVLNGYYVQELKNIIIERRERILLDLSNKEQTTDDLMSLASELNITNIFLKLIEDGNN